MKFKLALLGIFCVSVLFSQTAKVDTIKVMTYNLLNFPDGRNDCGPSNLVITNRVDTLAKIIQYALPDIFIANEVQNTAGATLVLNRAMNVNGRTNYRTATFGYNNSGGFVNNSIFYNSDKLILLRQNIITTSVRPIDHYIFYGVDPLLGTHFDTTFFEVFAMHLKAGSASENAATRLEQANLIRAYVDARPIGRNYIIGGDMNVYRSSEAGYVKMTTGGTNPFKDPINRPGSWNSNTSFKDIHTQSTRTTQNIECGSTGGLDDRFDQILVSANILSPGNRVKYIQGTYKSIGNDGNHYNNSIISGTNSMYPRSLVSALYYMSDHLPVIMSLKVDYPLTNGLALQPLIDPIKCNGESTGRIEIIPHAGRPPYTYTWDYSANTSNIAMNLAPGDYCVSVKDALNEIDDICVSIGETSALTTSIMTFDEEIGCDGTGLVSAQGGVPPYEFRWSNGTITTMNVTDNLCSGDQYVDVVDANDCVKRIQFTISAYSDVKNVQLIEANVYPNPSKDILNIDWFGNNKVEFEIFDLMGKKMNCEILEDKLFKTTLSLQGLEAGIYIVQVKGLSWSKKIIKE